ncbi:MAG: hypothetical protein ACMUJM_18550 [bacterium]
MDDELMRNISCGIGSIAVGNCAEIVIEFNRNGIFNKIEQDKDGFIYNWIANDQQE